MEATQKYLEKLLARFIKAGKHKEVESVLESIGRNLTAAERLQFLTGLFPRPGHTFFEFDMISKIALRFQASGHRIPDVIKKRIKSEVLKAGELSYVFRTAKMGIRLSKKETQSFYKTAFQNKGDYYKDFVPYFEVLKPSRSTAIMLARDFSKLMGRHGSQQTDFWENVRCYLDLGVPAEIFKESLMILWITCKADFINKEIPKLLGRRHARDLAITEKDFPRLWDKYEYISENVSWAESIVSNCLGRSLTKKELNSFMKKAIKRFDPREIQEIEKMRKQKLTLVENKLLVEVAQKKEEGMVYIVEKGIGKEYADGYIQILAKSGDFLTAKEAAKKYFDRPLNESELLLICRSK